MFFLTKSRSSKEIYKKEVVIENYFDYISAKSVN